jgi:hypothetical protein
VEQLLAKLHPEEASRFERQIIQSNNNLLGYGHRLAALQHLPIDVPDPVPKRRIIQRKEHGKAQARGLTSAELAQRELAAKERQERTQARATAAQAKDKGKARQDEDDEGMLLVPDTPPRSILLAIRSTGTSHSFGSTC